MSGKVRVVVTPIEFRKGLVYLCMYASLKDQRLAILFLNLCMFPFFASNIQWAIDLEERSG